MDKIIWYILTKYRGIELESWVLNKKATRILRTHGLFPFSPILQTHRYDVELKRELKSWTDQEVYSARS